ncbi:MAG: glycogen/starch/alpha-glucan phosphorylase [Candidatus Anammoxibacter sp.]
MAELYKDKLARAKKVVLNIAGMGTFSSDRAIMQYNKDIRNLKKTAIS